MKLDLRREAITAACWLSLLAGAAFADPWRQGDPEVRPRHARCRPHPLSERHEPGPAFGSSAGAFRPGMAGARPCRGLRACLAHRGSRAQWRPAVSRSSSDSDSSA